MSPELEQRIRRVFPNGNDHELDKSQFIADTGQRLQQVFDQVQQSLPVAMSMGFSNDRSFEFVVTDSTAPKFDDWCFTMKNPDKLKWIAANGGAPYVACWFTVSRVRPGSSGRGTSRASWPSMALCRRHSNSGASACRSS